MKSRIQIPNTDLALSLVGFGCVQAGLKWDHQEAERMFDAFLDMGGVLFDTARVYSDWVPPEKGRSERVLGDWLKRSQKRSKVVLCTKGGHPEMACANPDLHKSRVSREEMRTDVELSLKALKTDYLDLYLYHRDDERIPVSELIGIMEELVQEGKIRYYGCSNWSTARMQEADQYCKVHGLRGFAVNQALYNVGEGGMKPPTDDTLKRMDQEMQKYHREQQQNLAMPYMGNCGGFFQKLLARGPESVKNSEYFTERNLQMLERLKKIMEVCGCTMTQAVFGFFTCREFPCLPLYGPRNIADMQEAMETFAFSFSREMYETY